jgi:hypothetical protein
MLDNNDFDNMNREEYKKYFDSSILMAGLFELSNFFSYEVRPK